MDAALGLELAAEAGVTERDTRKRERESVLMCSLAENWTEEGELQCGCPHSI